LKPGFAWASAVQNYPERTDFRWAYTEGREGAPPAETSLALPYSGYYVMRTGWQPDAVWLFFDGGHLGTNHQHEDKLNVLLHAYGRLLLTEGGNYAYDDSEMRRYVLSTRAHNTARIDGLDQNRKEPFRARFRDQIPSDEEIMAELNTLNDAEWTTTAAYDRVRSAYREGYGPEIRSLATHEREILFLKQPPPPLGPCALVIDHLTPHDGQSHDYELLWHMDRESAQVAADNPLKVSSSDACQPNLTLIAAADPQLALTIVQGQAEPEWQGWKSLGSGKQQNYVPVSTPTYRWSSADARQVVTLLYPTPAGADCPVARLQVEGDGITLTLVNGAALTVNLRDYVR
jgi:hypothetical protein